MGVNNWLIKNRRNFLIAAIVGTGINVLAMLILQPWGPRLGVAMSMNRQYMRMIFGSFGFNMPWSLYAASIIAGKPKWLAPRGKYQEGVEYPVFTTYAYVAIALMAALFAASGILSYEFFDLPAAPAAVSVSFFHPIIGFFTLWLGGVLRSMIYGTDSPLMRLISGGHSDGGTWIYLGLFYWWAREETSWGKNLVKLLVFWVVVYCLWRFVYMFQLYVWQYPVPALWARVVWFWTSFLPSGVLGTVAGLIATEALIRAVERGR